MDALYSWDPKYYGLEDEKIDVKLETYFDFVKKYKAAKNLLKKKLPDLSEAEIDAMIEEEAALLETSTEKGNGNVSKSETSFVLDGRESIHTPCSVAHNAYVERVEEAGCQGAVGFAATACSDFHACMEQVESSYWICKPKFVSGILFAFKFYFQIMSNLFPG
ncbi:hypothetical protein ANCCAN_02503 [Ancylostoma caninum]|uniref:Uncharacterized protein n=1 Tax=Ancylostoma caninum TaxID=29170 RepID=A0A368H7N4_ANCCA|nr:hypothetical protein ANCCAN_02503 [Ancylostoma caninum]